RTSLLNGVYCAVAGVGITIYSLRRSWGDPRYWAHSQSSLSCYVVGNECASGGSGWCFIAFREPVRDMLLIPGGWNFAEKSRNVRTIVRALQQQKTFLVL